MSEGWRYRVRFKAVASTECGVISPAVVLDDAGQCAALDRAITDAWREQYAAGSRLEDRTLTRVRAVLVAMAQGEMPSTGGAEWRAE